MPQELFQSDIQIAIDELTLKKKIAVEKEDYKLAIRLNAEIQELEDRLPNEEEILDEYAMNIQFRNQEFKAFLNGQVQVLPAVIVSQMFL